MARRLAELAELVGGEVAGDAEPAVEAIRDARRRRSARPLVPEPTRATASRPRRAAPARCWSAPGVASSASATCWSCADPALRPGPAARPLPSAGASPAAGRPSHGGGRRRLRRRSHARTSGRMAVIGAAAGSRPARCVRALRRGRRPGAGWASAACSIPTPCSTTAPRSARGCVVHAGVVLGADGFGYATHGGVHHKVPQVGRVVVEDDVEIGANTAIDRATPGGDPDRRGHQDRQPGAGRAQRAGRPAAVSCAAQAGIAGSDAAGRRRRARRPGGRRRAPRARRRRAGGGQVGGAVDGRAAGTQVAGIPAIEPRKWRRQQAMLAAPGGDEPPAAGARAPARWSERREARRSGE